MEMNKKTNNTTESLAVEFVKNMVATVEAQLKIEVERNGYSLEDLRKGKIKLTRNVARSEADPRFVCESFAIGQRLIMAVKWNPGGYSIERNSESVAKAVQKSPNFGIKKDAPLNLALTATQREVEIEAGAQKYLADFYKERHLGKV